MAKKEKKSIKVEAFAVVYYGELQFDTISENKRGAMAYWLMNNEFLEENDLASIDDKQLKREFKESAEDNAILVKCWLETEKVRIDKVGEDGP